MPLTTIYQEDGFNPAVSAGPAHWPLEEPRRQTGVRPKNKTPPINDDDASVQENRQIAASGRPRGATVARLTPDQKVACSNHVGVKVLFSLAPRDKFGSEPNNCLSAGSQQEIFSYLFLNVS